MPSMFHAMLRYTLIVEIKHGVPTKNQKTYFVHVDCSPDLSGRATGGSALPVTGAAAAIREAGELLRGALNEGEALNSIKFRGESYETIEEAIKAITKRIEEWQ